MQPTMHKIATLVGFLFLVGCGAKAPPATVQPVQPEADASPARHCESQADCRAGEMCAGPEGCDVAWTCVPAQPCTRDAMLYCACDGETVHGSSTCPPRPYRHRGACP